GVPLQRIEVLPHRVEAVIAGDGLDGLPGNGCRNHDPLTLEPFGHEIVVAIRPSCILPGVASADPWRRPAGDRCGGELVVPKHLLPFRCPAQGVDGVGQYRTGYTLLVTEEIAAPGGGAGNRRGRGSYEVSHRLLALRAQHIIEI